jgi:ABC-type transport system involved in cytochrome bd biosynthesis fused ATPase/permease subunit
MDKYLRVCFVLVFVVITVVAVALWQGLHSFIFAWVLNFMLMFGVLYITETFKPSLISTYYNTKKWEAEGKIYKWFWVDGFRKILVWVGWEKLNKASNPVNKNLDTLLQLEYRTRQSEIGHLNIFVIVLIFNLVVVFKYGVIQSLWLFFLNIVLNVYPIIVQRYNRPRLQNIINRNKETMGT